MLLSLLIVALVAASAWRGWRRGMFVETVDIVGVVAVLAVSAAAWQPLGRVVGAALPVSATVASAIGSGVLALAGLAGVGWLSRWTARVGSTYVPLPLVRPARVGGAMFASTWMYLLVSGVLTLGLLVPGARVQAAGPVCDAPVARFLAGPSNPLERGARNVAEIGQPALRWLSQRVFDTFTLDATSATAADATDAADATEEVAVPPACTELARLRAASASAGALTSEGFRFEPVPAGELSAAPTAEAEVLALLNASRAAAGLDPVDADPELAAVARDHARDMYVRGFFAHDTPECRLGDDVAGCRDPFERIRDAGIAYRSAGENLALAPTSASAHEGLMRSPGHRANILAPDFGRVGIGVVDGPFGLMIAQSFADRP